MSISVIKKIMKEEGMIRWYSLVIAAISSSALGLPFAAQAAEKEVGVFFQSCMATVPTFSGVGDILTPLGFQSSQKGMWTKDVDGTAIRVSEEGDRWTCMVLQTGDHTTRFKNEVEKTLRDQFSGAWEQKSFEGRNIYLVRASNENVLIEVIPPYGASTILVANARKE